jgi:TetR/AcrR family transcriptional regulator, transcriptional repressor for nem operon
LPRISKQEKEQNRRRIVDSASRRFRVKGVDGTGLEEVMREAGMTHGGFYNHFGSKDALAVEVYRDAFAAPHAKVARAVAGAPGDAESSLQQVIDDYLSPRHRDAPDGGCPSAALATDAVRHGDDVQGAYRDGLNGYLDGFTAGLLRDAAARGKIVAPDAVRRQAITLLAEIVGALTLSRAVLRADPGLSEEILQAARDRVHAELAPAAGDKQASAGETAARSAPTNELIDS